MLQNGHDSIGLEDAGSTVDFGTDLMRGNTHLVIFVWRYLNHYWVDFS